MPPPTADAQKFMNDARCDTYEPLISARSNTNDGYAASDQRSGSAAARSRNDASRGPYGASRSESRTGCDHCAATAAVWRR